MKRKHPSNRYERRLFDKKKRYKVNDAKEDNNGLRRHELTSTEESTGSLEEVP